MEKHTIQRLRKNLSNTAKSIRHRRSMVNIHITFLTWIIEVVSGLMVFVGIHLLGIENHIVTFSLHILGHVINFIILPAIYLVNNEDTKIEVIESRWYNSILDIFKCQYSNQTEIDDKNTVAPEQLEFENDNETRSVTSNSAYMHNELNEGSDGPDKHESDNVVTDRHNDNVYCNNSIIRHTNETPLGTLDETRCTPLQTNECHVIEL